MYGWPKNFLHFHGIENAILDLVSTVRPHPHRSSTPSWPWRATVLLLGPGPALWDSSRWARTSSPSMRPVPERSHSILTGSPTWPRPRGFLGNVSASRIEQRGERLDRYQMSFNVLLDFAGLQLASGADARGTSGATPAHRRLWRWFLAASRLTRVAALVTPADADLWGHLIFGRDIVREGRVTLVDDYAFHEPARLDQPRMAGRSPVLSGLPLRRHQRPGRVQAGYYWSDAAGGLALPAPRRCQRSVDRPHPRVRIREHVLAHAQRPPPTVVRSLPGC